MERYAWKATVKAGMLDEYIQRHDNLWPEMKEMLRDAGIRNYTIWNVGNELFGYYECDSIQTASQVQSNSEINAKWDENIFVFEKHFFWKRRKCFIIEQ